MQTYKQAMADAQRRYFADLLEAAGGKIYLAAQLADVNRTDLYKRIKRVAPELLHEAREQQRKHREANAERREAVGKVDYTW